MSISSYLTNFLESGDIHKTDIILLHSNISRLYKNLKKENYRFSINDISDFFVNYFLSKGTMIIPTFNFDFCKGAEFSIGETVSQMGALSESLRLKSGKNRTWHPVYSFIIFGNVPKDLIEYKDYSAFGKKSVFEWLTNNEGKIGVIDLPDQKSMTYYHYVEECHKVKWRYMKTFFGNYKDFNNNVSSIKARVYVRNLKKNIKTKVDGMEKILWNKNLYKSKNRFSTKGCRSIRAKLLKKEVDEIILSNLAEGNLYIKDE